MTTTVFKELWANLPIKHKSWIASGVAFGLASLAFNTIRPKKCYYVDIGTYNKPCHAEGIQQTLRPAWWHIALPKREICGFEIGGEIGGYLLSMTSTCQFKQTDYDSAEPRPYAEWQKSLEAVVEEIEEHQALTPVLAGHVPTAAWVFLGRELSRTAPTPVIVNRSRDSQGAGWAVFDFAAANSWSFRRWWRPTLLSPKILHINDATEANDKRGIAFYVSPDPKNAIEDNQKTAIKQALANVGVDLRAIVVIGPKSDVEKVVTVAQTNIADLTAEICDIVRSTRDLNLQNNRQWDATAVVVSGPAPLGFIVGKALSKQFEGRLLAIERTEVAFDSGRKEERK